MTDSRAQEKASETVNWLAWLVKARQLDAFLSNELERFDLTLGEYEVLSALSAGSLPQSEISTRTGQSIPSVTRRLQSLELKNWITRRQTTRDRRRLTVELTVIGRGHLDSAGVGLDVAVSKLRSLLELNELHALTNMYRQIENFLAGDVGSSNRDSPD